MFGVSGRGAMTWVRIALGAALGAVFVLGYSDLVWLLLGIFALGVSQILARKVKCSREEWNGQLSLIVAFVLTVATFIVGTFEGIVAFVAVAVFCVLVYVALRRDVVDE